MTRTPSGDGTGCRPSFEVREPIGGEMDLMASIAGSLTEWFDEHARTQAIPVDLVHHKVFGAFDCGEPAGFITLFVSEGRLNIGWMGVRRDLQRKGIGKALVLRAEVHALELGLVELATYTLGDTVDYEPYESTRSFYLSCGFEVRQRNTTDNPGCPEEWRLVKRLRCREPETGEPENSPVDQGFSYSVRGTDEVQIMRCGRVATTLRGLEARRFIEDAAGCGMEDVQKLMARLTGNYRRGNERVARLHPRNRR